LRKKAVKFILFSFLISFFISCVQGGKSPGFEVALSPGMINAFLEKQFPVTQELKVGILTLKDPKIASIDEKEKLNLGLGFNYKVPLLPSVSGNLLVAGGIRYNPEKKAIYLKNPEIKDLQIMNKRLPSLLSAETKRVLSGVVSYVFDEIPIYRFNEKDFYGRFIKDIRVEKGKIILRFGI